MVLKGFKIRNIIDFQEYFNIAEVWKKKEDFLLFLETLLEDEIALEDIRIADEQDHKNDAKVSRVQLLDGLKKEGNEKFYQEFFITNYTDEEGFPLFFNIRSAFTSLENIVDLSDKVVLSLIYLIQNRGIDDQEKIKIRNLFPNPIAPTTDLSNQKLVFDDMCQRIDINLFEGMDCVKTEMKEINNKTREIQEVNVLQDGNIVFTFNLRPDETMYCIMAEGKFVRKLKTISMGRTHGAFREYDTGMVHSFPLSGYRGTTYQYPEMIAFTADGEKGILGFALPTETDEGSNVMAAVDIQNIPRDFYVIATGLLGGQYVLLKEDGTLVTNVYGAEDFKNLIDVDLHLNTIVGITSDRRLLSNTPYHIKSNQIMAVSLSNDQLAVLSMDGKVYTNNISHPVSTNAVEIGICKYGLFVLKKIGELYLVTKESEQRLLEVGANIAEISVSDTGIMYRTKEDVIGIYYYDTKTIQIVKG